MSNFTLIMVPLSLFTFESMIKGVTLIMLSESEFIAHLEY